MLHSNAVRRINITENVFLQVRVDFFRVYLSFHLKQQQHQQLFEWAKEPIFPNYGQKKLSSQTSLFILSYSYRNRVGSLKRKVNQLNPLATWHARCIMSLLP